MYLADVVISFLGDTLGNQSGNSDWEARGGNCKKRNIDFVGVTV